MTARDIYDRDFLEWTRCNAALLRAGRLEEVDAEHLAEEIEDLGKSQQRELTSGMRVLLTHLLTCRAQPCSRASQGWKATIRIQRSEIAGLMAQMPSLRNQFTADIRTIYPIDVAKAAAGIRVAESSFPEACPFSLDQILDDCFFPPRRIPAPRPGSEIMEVSTCGPFRLSGWVRRDSAPSPASLSSTSRWRPAASA
jgi:hypothetical protein